MGRERERQRERVFHWWFISQISATAGNSHAKAGVQNSIRVSHLGGRDLTTHAIFCLSRHPSRELGRSRAATTH